MALSDFFKGNGLQYKLFVTLALIILLTSIFSEAVISSESTISEQIKEITISNSFLIFYIKNFQASWYLMLLFFVIAFWTPFKKTFETVDALAIQLVISSTLVFSFLILSLITFVRTPNLNDGRYTVLVGVFTVLSIAIGWLISAQISRKHQKQNQEITRKHQKQNQDAIEHNHKRSHTLNIILQQRLSQEYHKNVTNVADVYPLTIGSIPEDDVKAYLNRHSTEQGEIEFSDDKIKAVRSTLFLLDLYEFICEGIKQGDLDEEVIYESIGGTILRNVKRSKYLIDAIVIGKYGEAIPKGFKTLLKYNACWSDKHAAEEDELIRSQNK